MSKFPRMMVALGAALIALLIAGAALAQQPPGQTFFGTAGDVSIDGNTAPAGTVIVAMSNGQEVGRDTLDGDGWQIDVPGDTGNVTFSVGGRPVDVPYPASQAGTNRITLNAVTPQEEPPAEEPATEPDGNGDELQGDDDSGSMMDDGDELQGDDTGSMMGEDDGDTGSMMGEDDGDTGSMMGEDDDSLDDSLGDGMGTDEPATGESSPTANGESPPAMTPDAPVDDGDAMDFGGTAGDDDAMDSDGTMGDDDAMDSDGTMGSGDDAMGEDDALGSGDDAMGDDDALGSGDDAMGDDDALDSDDSMTGDEDPPAADGTVGGVTGLSTTGTGGLTERGSSAALWGSIGGTLALTALLLGGFAVRRRRAQSQPNGGRASRPTAHQLRATREGGVFGPRPSRVRRRQRLLHSISVRPAPHPRLLPFSVTPAHPLSRHSRPRAGISPRNLGGAHTTPTPAP